MKMVATLMIGVALTCLTAQADTITFGVVGMDCAGCGPPLVKALKSVEGVRSATVDTKANKATVDVPAGFDREKIRTAVSHAGFAAVFAGEKPREIEALPADVVAKLDIITYRDGKRVDLSKVVASGKVTIVDFYGEWCGPCHVLETRLHHLMQGRDDLALRRIDIGKWDNQAAKQATQLRAKSLPYIRVYDARGKFVTAVTGGMWDEVLEAIDKAAR
jgi:copper chaperone CopZ